MQYPDESELAYWIMRQADERAKSKDDTLPCRGIHGELADRYAHLIAQILCEERLQA